MRGKRFAGFAVSLASALALSINGDAAEEH